MAQAPTQQSEAGDRQVPRWLATLGWPVVAGLRLLLLVTLAILLLLLPVMLAIYPQFWGSRSSSDADRALIVFIGLPIAFILFDLVRFLFGMPREAKTTASGYQPNLQIWGIGLLLGIGAVVVYLFGTVTLALLGEKPADSLAVWQHLGLLLILSIMFCFIVWAVVKLCQPE